MRGVNIKFFLNFVVNIKCICEFFRVYQLLFLHVTFSKITACLISTRTCSLVLKNLIIMSMYFISLRRDKHVIA